MIESGRTGMADLEALLEKFKSTTTSRIGMTDHLRVELLNCRICPG